MAWTNSRRACGVDCAAIASPSSFDSTSPLKAFDTRASCRPSSPLARSSKSALRSSRSSPPVPSTPWLPTSPAQVLSSSSVSLDTRALRSDGASLCTSPLISRSSSWVVSLNQPFWSRRLTTAWRAGSTGSTGGLAGVEVGVGVGVAFGVGGGVCARTRWEVSRARLMVTPVGSLDRGSLGRRADFGELWPAPARADPSRRPGGGHGAQAPGHAMCQQAGRNPARHVSQELLHG